MYSIYGIAQYCIRPGKPFLLANSGHVVKVVSEPQLIVSRSQTTNFFTGRYRLQYKRPLILQVITPCKKLAARLTTNAKVGCKNNIYYLLIHKSFLVH